VAGSRQVRGLENGDQKKNREHSDSVAISVCESAIGDEWRAETGLSLPVELGAIGVTH